MHTLKDGEHTRDTQVQREYIDQFRAKAESDSRVRAAWLEGSFGRGNADRYSDLDFHLMISPESFNPFRNDLDSWLAEIRPVPYCVLRFEKMVNALTDNGLRIDIWLHAEPQISVVRNKASILVDKGGCVTVTEPVSTWKPGPTAQILSAEIGQFWRCIALLPSVVGRDELIIGFQGLSVEIGSLTNLLLVGYGIEHDRGVKNLNQFLPEPERREIEAAITMQGLSRQSLVSASLELSRLMQHYGRVFAEKHGFEYPLDLEKAVLNHVRSELDLLKLPK